MLNSLASLPWWYQTLIISSLVLFNSFCLIGTIAGFYSIVILANIDKATKVTTASVLNKLDSMEQNIAEWSWLAAPIGAIVGGAFLGRKKNVGKDGFGMFGDILKKIIK